MAGLKAACGLGLSLLLVTALGCKKKVEDAPAAAAAGGRAVKLGAPQNIPFVPMTMRLAPGWTAERLDGSDVPMPDTPWPAMIDFSETLEVWRVTGTSPSGRADPFILITVDRRLPKGTTFQQYMTALRKDQLRHLPGKITHAEWEPLTRNGRPGFAMRQAMEIPGPTGSTPMLQTSRVFLNGTMGVVITAVMLDDDRARLDPELRAMFDSLRFTSAPPKEP